jgi:hypothetical protein
MITNFTFSFKRGPAAASNSGSGAGSSAGSSSSNVLSTLLPVAVDLTEWNDFYKNGVTSVYADPNAPSGVAWFQIFPGGTGSSMDGLLSLNGAKAASQQFYSGGFPNPGWIEGGPTAADMAGMNAAGNLPLPTNGTGNSWPSGPGMKSSNLPYFQSLVVSFQSLVTDSPGVHLLPLYDPNSPGTTTGGNGTYQICYFVPIYVVYAQGRGKANMDIAVVPASGSPITDPTIVLSSVAPLGTSSIPPQFLTPVPAKLTQ